MTGLPAFTQSSNDETFSIIEGMSISDGLSGVSFVCRANIKKATKIYESIILGNTFYKCPKNQNLPQKFEIGENCLIKKAIRDEHVHIGNNVNLTNEKKLKTYDGEKLFVRDGIIIIPANTNLPDNFSF